MANLYELTGVYASLVAQLDYVETDDELDAILHELDLAVDDITDKAEAYARIIKNKQAEAASFKAESQRLAKKQKAAESVIEHMKAQLKDTMLMMNVTQLPTSIGKWSIRANPLKCDVIDVKAVPEEYRVMLDVPYTINKDAIKKHFKETGEILPGVEVFQEQGIRFN